VRLLRSSTGSEVRVGDAERSRAVTTLGGGCAAGYLSVDTLEHRIALALRARTRSQLARVLADLPRGPRWWRRPRLREPSADAVPPPAVELRLPRAPFDQPLLVGRGAMADLRFPHMTVSRRHALVSVTEEGAYITDVGSANGTAVNGQPVVTAPLREGDVVTFGLLAARVVRD
jgi:FHA domain/Domain of unknown function (DUF1707)